MKTTTLLYLATCFVASEAVINVAMNSNAGFCRGDKFLVMITDGDKSITSGFSTEEVCENNAYVAIDFGGPVYAHYVVVYESQSEGAPRGQLDYFTVRTISRGDVYHPLCGAFPQPSHGPIENNGMRVNCMYMDTTVNSILLNSQLNVRMNVAEIEVYSFALEAQEDFIWIPRGCYRNVTTKTIIPLLHWKNCKTECKNAGVVFAAIKNNEECHCVLEYDESHHRPLRECDMKCTDSDYYCGGESRYSVYIVQVWPPKYISCVGVSVVPHELLVETFTEENMTIALCISKCELYPRALLLGGSTCVCAIDQTINIAVENSKLNNRDGMQPQSCNMKCSGDSKSMCGGSDHFSVYRTCYSSREFVRPCKMFFKCFGEVDQFGACKSGCQKGFIGEHCLERRSLEAESEATGDEGVCYVYNPCDQILYSECSDEDGYHTCECLLGEDNDTGLCMVIEMEECLLGSCYLKTPKCHDIRGKRICKCMSSYYHILDYCIDFQPFLIALSIAFMVLMIHNSKGKSRPGGFDDPKTSESSLEIDTEMRVLIFYPSFRAAIRLVEDNEGREEDEENQRFTEMNPSPPPPPPASCRTGEKIEEMKNNTPGRSLNEF